MKPKTHILLCLLGFIGLGVLLYQLSNPRGVATCVDDGLGLRAGDRPVDGGICSSCVDMAGVF